MEPWKLQPAEELFENIVDKNHPDDTVLTIIQGSGTLPRCESSRNIRYDEKGVANYKKVNMYDYIIHLRSFEGGLEMANSQGIISPAYTVLRSKKEFAPLFYDAYFHTDEFINHILAKSVEGIRDGRQISYEAFKWLPIPTCNIEEQRKIADLFRVLNDRIKAQQLLVDSLKKYKRGAFECVFSQKIKLTNCNTPWKKFKLSDFATRITRKNGEQTDIPLTISAQYGLIDQRNFFSKTVASTDMSGYYLLKSGEFAYNRSTSNDYPFGSIKRLEKYKKGAVSTLYICFEINKEIMNSDFITLFFESTKWHKQISEICAEGARNHGLLNVPTNGFFDCVFDLPSNLDEQEKIASFLNSIQDKLDNENKILEQLQFFKKALLQSMFI